MRKYYIVTRADLSDNGHFMEPTRVFQDDDGNTELYINAEEARESLAKDVAEMCKDGKEFALNDEAEVHFETWKEVYEYVMKNLKPEAYQMVEVIRGVYGSKRCYTINSITI